MISNNSFSDDPPSQSVVAWTIVAWFLGVATLLMSVLPELSRIEQTASGVTGMLFAQAALTGAFSLSYPKAPLVAAALAAAFPVAAEIIAYFTTQVFAIEWKIAGFVIGLAAAHAWNRKRRQSLQ
ncbi:hypothetical protein [Rhizobium binxianense]